jgi:hypothetical protein
MTRHKTLQCVHEPFGDAYYFGPERLAERYENDPEARKESGYSASTYRTIFDRIAKENSEVRTNFSGVQILISRARSYPLPRLSEAATNKHMLIILFFFARHDLRHVRFQLLHNS